MNLADIEILTFDCYGTLIDWETGILTALRPWLERSGCALTDDTVLEAYARAESAAELQHPKMPYPDILRTAFDRTAVELGIALDPAAREAFATSIGDWPAFADTRPALTELGARYQLGILSNVDRVSFAASNERLGVELDVIMTAQDIGSYKPDLANFRYMITTLAGRGIERHQILHVAQSLHHDIEPALQIGLSCVWIDRRHAKQGFGATMAPTAQAAADLRFTSLQELASALR